MATQGKIFAAYMIDKDTFPLFHTLIRYRIAHRKEIKMAYKFNANQNSTSTQQWHTILGLSGGQHFKATLKLCVTKDREMGSQ